VTLSRPFPVPLTLNDAMSDANDEALPSRLIVALAPARCGLDGREALVVDTQRLC